MTDRRDHSIQSLTLCTLRENVHERPIKDILVHTMTKIFWFYSTGQCRQLDLHKFRNDLRTFGTFATDWTQNMEIEIYSANKVLSLLPAASPAPLPRNCLHYVPEIMRYCSPRIPKSAAHPRTASTYPNTSRTEMDAPLDSLLLFSQNR